MPELRKISGKEAIKALENFGLSRSQSLPLGRDRLFGNEAFEALLPQ